MSMASPMDSNEGHRSSRRRTPSRETPQTPVYYDFWKQESNEAGGSSSQQPENVHQDTGEYSGYPPYQQEAYWNNPSYAHHSGMAGGSGSEIGSGSHGYDMNSHFTSGMELGGAIPLQILPEQDPYLLQTGQFHGIEGPSAEDISNRYERYNLFSWQKALKVPDLEIVYNAVGRHWRDQSEKTFAQTWTKLNEYLDEHSSYIPLILRGNHDIIERVKATIGPPTRRASRLDTPRWGLIMKAFLERHRRTGGRYLTVQQHQQQQVQDWLPPDWNPNLRVPILQALKKEWRGSWDIVQARVASYGPDAIAEFGPRILGHDPKDVSNAIKDMVAWYKRRHKDRRQHTQALQQINEADEEEPEIEQSGQAYVNVGQIDWAPEELDMEEQQRLIKQLETRWRIAVSNIIGELIMCGKGNVAHYGKIIVGRDPKAAERALKQLRSLIDRKQQQAISQAAAPNPEPSQPRRSRTSRRDSSSSHQAPALTQDQIYEQALRGHNQYQEQQQPQQSYDPYNTDYYNPHGYYNPDR